MSDEAHCKIFNESNVPAQCRMFWLVLVATNALQRSPTDHIFRHPKKTNHAFPSTLSSGMKHYRHRLVYTRTNTVTTANDDVFQAKFPLKCYQFLSLLRQFAPYNFKFLWKGIIQAITNSKLAGWACRMDLVPKVNSATDSPPDPQAKTLRIRDTNFFLWHTNFFQIFQIC